jgi:anti-sigma B factor antagonist
MSEAHHTPAEDAPTTEAAGWPQPELVVRSPRPGVTVIDIGGELDIVSAPVVTERLGELSRGQARHLILDLSRVTFMSSAGVAMLIAATDQAGDIGRVHLVGVAGNSQVRRVLEITGLSRVFGLYDGVEDALAGVDG